ncbi:DUF5666 domain-containing protein [Kribbella italica]|uniref:DUF5666 domain-containing protein n=1 Tax=Kribbella italica TaxID=1540520 RepID=A0A7W9J4I1_9ACTN|nr:DUF5666 domain-containing protein [Kribbella italica]MBB5835403.1 hypothetical protein [Kribbella italica]
MSNQTPDDFAQIGSDQEVEAALRPQKTFKLPVATAVLSGVVVLAIGLAGGAGLHAAFASDSPAPQAGRGAGGYGGFRGQGGGQGGGPGPGAANAAVGTVVSAADGKLVVKTQNGDVTVKLTGDTAYEISSKGSATDLKAGEQVVVSGETADGTLTARTVRQGGIAGFGRTPNPTASPR